MPPIRHTLQSEGRAERLRDRRRDQPARPPRPARSTHFEGETLVENIGRFLAGEELEGTYDGHANCFIETGFHKALLIDFNYEVEPLPGPLPRARTSDRCRC